MTCGKTWSRAISDMVRGISLRATEDAAPRVVVLVVTLQGKRDLPPSVARFLGPTKARGARAGPGSTTPDVVHARVGHLVGDSDVDLTQPGPLGDTACSAFASKWLVGCFDQAQGPGPVHLIVCVPGIHTWTIGEAGRFLGLLSTSVRHGRKDPRPHFFFSGLILQGFDMVLPYVGRTRGGVPSAGHLLDMSKKAKWGGVPCQTIAGVKEYQEGALAGDDHEALAAFMALDLSEGVLPKPGDLSPAVVLQTTVLGKGLPSFAADKFLHIKHPQVDVLPPGFSFPVHPQLIRGDVIQYLCKLRPDRVGTLLQFCQGGPLVHAMVLWTTSGAVAAFQVKNLAVVLGERMQCLDGTGSGVGAGVGAGAGAPVTTPVPVSESEPASMGTGPGTDASPSHPNKRQRTQEGAPESGPETEVEPEAEGGDSDPEFEVEPEVEWESGSIDGGPKGVQEHPWMTDAGVKAFNGGTGAKFGTSGPGCPIVIDFPTRLLEYVVSAGGRQVTIVVLGSPEEHRRVTNAVVAAATVAASWCTDVGINGTVYDRDRHAFVKSRLSAEDIRRGATSRGCPLFLVVTPDQVDFLSDFTIVVVERGCSLDTIMFSPMLRASGWNPGALMEAQMRHLREHINPLGTLVILADDVPTVHSMFSELFMSAKDLEDSQLSKPVVSFVVNVAVAVSVFMKSSL